MPGRQLAIVPFGLGRRLGVAYRFDLGVGKLFDSKRLTVPPLEALVFV